MFNHQDDWMVGALGGLAVIAFAIGVPLFILLLLFI